MAYAAGVDVGSTQTKAVVIDEHGAIVGPRADRHRRERRSRAAERAFARGAARRRRARGGGRVRRRHRLRPLQGHVRQHAGHRDQLPRPRRRAHVPRHAHRGRHGRPGHEGDPRRRRRGEIVDFCMNDKCAAGTGRFLGAASAALDIPLDELGPHGAARRAAGARSARPARCSPSPRCCRGSARARRSRTSCSACTSRSPSRSAGLLRRVGIEDEVTFTGGVARNIGMIERAERGARARGQRQRGVALHGRARARRSSRCDHILASRAPAAARQEVRHEDHRRHRRRLDLHEGGRCVDERRRDRSAARCEPTGFQLAEVARAGAATTALAPTPASTRERRRATSSRPASAGTRSAFADVHVTDLTAAARGARALFPGTRTILDVGGQTMKASRLDEDATVQSFRLNDKCAAGTGAFLEKTARYMGYATEEIGPLVATVEGRRRRSPACARCSPSPR